MPPTLQRSLTNLLTDDVDATARFYEELLGMSRHFDSDWFVILSHPDLERFEFGILRRDHEIVPDVARSAAGGVMLTFVTDDCDRAEQRAKQLGAEIIEPPRDMPYGQRRMLLRDPVGTCVDISAPTAAAPET